jgi:hypothetical protein
MEIRHKSFPIEFQRVLQTSVEHNINTIFCIAATLYTLILEVVLSVLKLITSCTYLSYSWFSIVYSCENSNNTLISVPYPTR